MSPFSISFPVGVILLILRVCLLLGIFAFSRFRNIGITVVIHF